MNMKIKYPFKNHLANSFFIYFGVLVVVPVLCTYAVLQRIKPKDYERFSVFSDIEFANSGLFKDYLFTELKEDLVIDTYDMNRNENLFNSYFSSYGLNSDICILSKTTLDKFESVDFVNLNDTIYEQEDSYRFKDICIGVLCHQKESTKLKEYFNFSIADDDYYITINKNSVHLKEITSSGLTDQVARVINLLTK